MKKILIIIFLILIISGCKQAMFNNPLEGAGGLFIGFKQRTGNSVLVSNFPVSIDEDGTITFEVKLSQKIDSNAILIINPENALLKVSSPLSGELIFTADNFNIDQSVTLTLLPSDKITPIDIGINLQSASLPNTHLVISGNYKFSRKIDFTGPTSIAEEIPGILKAKLRKQPQANATVTLTSNSAVTINPSQLTFTPTNYATEQSFSVSINDIYNDNRNYTITGTSDSENSNYSFSVVDNDYAIVDISTATGMVNNSGMQPSIAIDQINNRFFVVTKNASVAGGNRPLIYRCDSLYGTSCNSYPSKTSTLSANSGYYPHVVFDSTNQNLHIMAQDFNLQNDRGMKIDGNLSGTIDCSSNNASCNLLWGSASSSANGFNLLANSGKIVFIRVGPIGFATRECDRSNISNCIALSSFVTVSSQGLGGLGTRAFLFDQVSSQIFGVGSGDHIISSTNYTFIPRGTITSANGQVTASALDITNGSLPVTNYGYTPDLAVDSINNRLIIATFDYSSQGGGAGRPGLAFCNKTITTCSYKSIPGILYPSYHPKLLWDGVNKKILIITYNVSKKPYLHHCDENGNNCSEVDLSRGQTYTITEPEISGHNFDAAIDTFNNRVLLTFADGTTGKLILLRFGLGGL